jgi:CRP-like cAMP-binding protein
MLFQERLSGKSVLIVEDDYFAAAELATRLSATGVRIVGPAPNVDTALETIASTTDLACAVLDINLDGTMVFPVADELDRLGVPFVFATGYEPEIVPPRHSDKIVMRKPLEDDAVTSALSHVLSPASICMQDACQNKFLAGLPSNELALLLPHLRRVFLPRGAVMEAAGQIVSRVYFPIECVNSLIAVGSQGKRIEAGLIGREGMTGTGILVGDDQTPHDLINQIEGHALAVAVEDIRRATTAAPHLGLLAGRFCRSLAVQVAHTALANGAFGIPQRLARWLLMVHDRVDGDAFELTHEYLAIMLAIRRPSVTGALHVLEGEGLIRSTRGKIRIRHRARLVEYAGEAYGIPEAEHERLMALPLQMERSSFRPHAVA